MDFWPETCACCIAFFHITPLRSTVEDARFVKEILGPGTLGASSFGPPRSASLSWFELSRPSWRPADGARFLLLLDGAPLERERPSRRLVSGNKNKWVLMCFFHLALFLVYVCPCLSVCVFVTFCWFERWNVLCCFRYDDLQFPVVYSWPMTMLWFNQVSTVMEMWVKK